MAIAADSLKSNEVMIASIKPSAAAEHICLFSDCGPPGILLYETSANFRRLAASLTNSWEQSLANLPVLAPDPLSRLILFSALLYLPPDEYLKCLNRALDLYLEKKISRDEFLNIFWLPPRVENAWFLSFNYANPKLIALLKRVRDAFKDDKDIVSSVDFIASGRAKFRDELMRREDSSLSKRKIPLLVEAGH